MTSNSSKMKAEKLSPEQQSLNTIISENDHYQLFSAETEEAKRLCYRVCYQSYCIENNLGSVVTVQNGNEVTDDKDKLETTNCFLVVSKPSMNAVASMRSVYVGTDYKNLPCMSPIQNQFRDSTIPDEEYGIYRILGLEKSDENLPAIELTRVNISKTFLRRSGAYRRKGLLPFMVVGSIFISAGKELIQYCTDNPYFVTQNPFHNIQWIAFMQEGLAEKWRKIGFKPAHVSRPFNVLGERRVYRYNVSSCEEMLDPKNVYNDAWSFFDHEYT